MYPGFIEKLFSRGGKALCLGLIMIMIIGPRADNDSTVFHYHTPSSVNLALDNPNYAALRLL